MHSNVDCGRPQHKAPLDLKGGDGSEFPVDAATALKIHAGVFAFFGALCIPDLNLPLLDMTFKLHDTRASLFYNDLSPESETLVKANRWIGASFLAVGVMISDDADVFVMSNDCFDSKPNLFPCTALTHSP